MRPYLGQINRCEGVAPKRPSAGLDRVDAKPIFLPLRPSKLYRNSCGVYRAVVEYIDLAACVSISQCPAIALIPRPQSCLLNSRSTTNRFLERGHSILDFEQAIRYFHFIQAQVIPTLKFSSG